MYPEDRITINMTLTGDTHCITLNHVFAGDDFRLGGFMGDSITLVGAPSNIGIKPYDDGTPRRLDLAPAVLRDLDLVARLSARDAGNVPPPPYLDMVRPVGRPRNERGVVEYSYALADHVASALSDGSFTLVLGGDCSIVLGCLLGARAARDEPIGLVYIDAHSDFATTQESITGSPAAMCAAMAVGRGDSALARLGSGGPLVDESSAVMIGRRDDAYGDAYGIAALRASRILDLSNEYVRARGAGAAAAAALAHVARSGAERFWIHVDADVLDPAVMPAVDSPEPDGLSADTLAELLVPLASSPGAIGLELTIYDPQLDPDRRAAHVLVGLLERVLVGR
jgi:arginase